MAVYVDGGRIPYRGMLMCHMVADTEAELHFMAAQIGIRRAWFQDHGKAPHYDLCQTKRALAVAKGAIEVDRRGLIRIVRKSSLRGAK